MSPSSRAPRTSKTEGHQAHRARRAVREQEFLASNKHDVAHFINAYVYGNILILAAIITVNEHSIEEGHAWLMVLGTGVATFVAHFFAETQEYDVVREGEDTKERSKAATKKAVVNARPIYNSAIAPTAVFFLAAQHVLAAGLAWQIAIWIVFWRLGRIGFIIAKFRGEKTTIRTMLQGIILAVTCLGIAQLKVLLTH